LGEASGEIFLADCSTVLSRVGGHGNTVVPALDSGTRASGNLAGSGSMVALESALAVLVEVAVTLASAKVRGSRAWLVDALELGILVEGVEVEIAVIRVETPRWADFSTLFIVHRAGFLSFESGNGVSALLWIEYVF